MEEVQGQRVLSFFLTKKNPALGLDRLYSRLVGIWFVYQE